MRVVPIIIFSLAGGVVADAMNRRKVMLVTQIVLTLSAAVLALLTLQRADRRLAAVCAHGA